METTVRLELDGVIISNHGGKQIDVCQATINSLQTIAPLYKDKIKVMMDSGIRGGITFQGHLPLVLTSPLWAEASCTESPRWAIKEGITRSQF
jgi:hypothetical protein